MKPGFVFFLVVLLMGCTDTTNIPKGVLPKQKMEALLWDLIQADRFSALFLLKDSTQINIHAENLQLYNRVLQIHHLSKEEFTKSYRFYLSRPDITKVIFDTISARAERQREFLYKSDSVVKNLSFPTR